MFPRDNTLIEWKSAGGGTVDTRPIMLQYPGLGGVPPAAGQGGLCPSKLLYSLLLGYREYLQRLLMEFATIDLSLAGTTAGST